MIDPDFSKLELHRAHLLDYYDGPVSGVFTLPDTGSLFAFNMLEWDDNKRYRIFVVHNISDEQFREFNDLVPDITTTIPLDPLSLDRAIELISSSSPERLLLWDSKTKVVIKSFRLPPYFHVDPSKLNLNGTNDKYWFTILGIKI